MTSTEIAPQFFSIEVGSVVIHEDKCYRVTHRIAIDTVMAVDLSTGESATLPVERLRLAGADIDIPADVKDRPQDLSLYSAQEWKEGQRRLQAIQGLLENPDRSRDEAAKMAKAADVHVSTLYRWLAEYVRRGNVTALVPFKRGRKVGARVLAPEVEAILDAVIEEFYLHKQRRTPEDVIEEVRARCRLAKVVPPHANTVRNRLKRVPEIVKLKRRGRSELARNRFSPIRGSIHAPHPYSVVQIDHTPIDCIVVDEVHRQPIGRPFLTLAICVHSRMVGGLYMSLDPPSSAAVSLCLANAMCTKAEYLARLGIPGNWPVWGKMATIHVDNAKEFRGSALERGAQQHGIDLLWRPPKTPNYGGHIERLMGTTMRRVHKLPGTTFSSVDDKAEYDSEAEAVLTLRELEVEIVDFIVNKYHIQAHKTIGVPPIKMWQRGIIGTDDAPGVGQMPIPSNPLRLEIDFMPLDMRTVQRYGIQWDNISYYDPVLDSYINSSILDDEETKQKFLVRRDPRDISKIYFFDPASKLYVTLPYRNIGHPPISLYELKEVRKRLTEEGIRDIDENIIFEYVARSRKRVDEATRTTKAARRAQARSHPSAKSAAAPFGSGPVAGNRAADQPSEVRRQVVEDDIFAEPIKPFDELGMR